MTTTMSDFDSNEKPSQGKLVMIGVLFTVAIAITIGCWWRDRTPPEPNFSGYYEGPWVNKRGELVSPEGNILRSRVTHTSQDPTVLLP